MPRIKIETTVPKNTLLDDARKSARLAACEALNIHIVEESVVNVPDSPSDALPGTVDRVLTTWWNIQE